MDARAVREDRFMARRVLVGSGPMPTFSNEADKFMRIRSSLCIQDGWSRDEHPAGKTVNCGASVEMASDPNLISHGHCHYRDATDGMNGRT